MADNGESKPAVGTVSPTQPPAVATPQPKAAAKAAHWDGPVTVLDYGTPAPAGAQILLLTWDRGMASLVQGTNKAYLGVVIYRPLAFHPDHERIIRQIAPSTRPEEHYDSLLRAHTEMRLFVALQLAAEHEKKS